METSILKSSNLWVEIGNTAFSGDLNQGFLVSEKFVPSDFAAITFGTLPLPLDTFALNNPTLGNYFVSPNGDGINDFYLVNGTSNVSQILSLDIYDRWGNQVFNNQNFPINNESEAWDGTFRQELTNAGAYVYIAQVQFADGNIQLFKGDITLIR